MSETIGSLGLPGQILGETARVYLLGSALPVANSISSVTLDRGLYIVAAALVSVTGVVTALLLLPLSGSWRVFAFLFASALAALLVVIAIAFRRRWPVLSGTAKCIGRLPWFKNRLEGKQSVIDSGREQSFQLPPQSTQGLLDKLDSQPGMSWYGSPGGLSPVLLHGSRIGPLRALVLEAFTKLINVVGALNPGNFGTYEGGNMILTRLLGIAGAPGLTLGLCRRARSIFWKAVGFLCLVAMSRSTLQTRRSLPVRYNAVEVS